MNSDLDRGEAHRSRFFRHSSFDQVWTRFVSIGLLTLLSLSAAAQESKKEWRISSPSGHATVYDTQQEAVEAIKTLPAPPPYPPEFQGGWEFVDKIKPPPVVAENGDISITYWMGMEQPNDPDWKYVGNAIYATEAEMVAGLNAQFQEISSPSCSPLTLEAQGDWEDLVPELAGRQQVKHFVVTVQFGDNTPEYPCEPYSQDLHPARFRRMDCPNPYTSWSDEHNACVNEEFVAVVTGEAEICTADDTVAPLDNSGMQGNPCDVKTGDKYETEPDFNLGWLDLVRYYHSNIAASSGGFGPGWSDTHRMRLAIHPPAMGLIDGSGYTVPFLKVGSEYRATNGSGQRILASGSQWLLHRQDAVYAFDEKGRLVTRQHPDGNRLTYGYDTAGRLATVSSAQGRSIQFQYADTSGDALITEVSSAGVALATYTYDQERLKTVTYPGGGVRTYHYEDTRFPRHLTGITTEDSLRYSTFAYDAKGRAISSQHAGGIDGVTLSYASTGTTVTDALGKVTAYVMTDAGGGSPKVASVTDGSGTVSFGYHDFLTDYRRRLSVVTDRNGTQIRHTYSEVTDAVTGQPARVHTVTEAYGLPEQRVSEERRDLASNRLLSTRVGDLETRYAYNARLQPSGIVVKDVATSQTRVTTLTYCEAADVAASGSTCPIEGLPKLIDGARTDVADTTVYAYYGGDHSACATTPASCTYRKGDLWKATNALGHVIETLAYDAAGRTTAIKDANGVVINLEYDTRGRLTARKIRGTNNATEIDDRITRYEYWPTSLVKKVIQPDATFLTFAYDAAQRLTSITDKGGNSVHYVLDDAGNRLQENIRDTGGALKRTLSRVFNTLGQLTVQADAQANPTDYAYDADGNLDTVTDALNRVADQDHDPLNRLKRTLQDVGGIDAETELEYDALDNVTKVTDPKGLETSYTYNGFGEVTQLNSPDTGTTTYTYDTAGNRKTRTDARGITETYTYDALNRPIAVSYSDGTAGIAYAYDTGSETACQAAGIASSSNISKGRLTRITDATGDTYYCHNRFGHVSGKSQVGVNTFNVLYNYAVSGRLQTIVYPGYNYVEYLYNSLGQVTTIKTTSPGGPTKLLLKDATYAPLGPVTGWTWGNNRTLHRPVDMDYRTSSIHDAAAGGLSAGYRYDSVGNIDRLRDATQTIQQASYGYDGLDRLTLTNGPTGLPVEAYAYDKTGNRTAFTNSGGAQVYSYAGTSHRLTAVAGSTRTYDSAGNTLSIAATDRAFVHDGAGRIAQAKTLATGAVLMHYRYNGKGERTQRFTGDPATTSTHSVYDEQGRWLGDYDANGVAKQQVIWLGDLPVGLLDGAFGAQQLHYIEPDHLGTPRVVIEPVRDVAVWSWDIKGEAFGDSAPNQDPDGDSTAFVFDMRFPGQRYDSATGLNYNYFRDYEPGTDRYTQSDPIGLKGGISTYSYVAANPIGRIDPIGLATYVVVTYDFGFGSHTALFIDGEHGKEPFLYDPAGSYGGDTRGLAGIFEGKDNGASLVEYLNYQRGTGSIVEITRLNTSKDEEERFKITAEDISDPRGLSCASSVSSVLSGYCGVIKHTIFPGVLGDYARDAKLKQENGTCPVN